MFEKKLGSVVVVDPNCNVTGIFTTTDALRLLTELLSGSRDRNYELSVEEYFAWDPQLGESFLGSPDCDVFSRESSTAAS
jgi:hypothetical protein